MLPEHICISNDPVRDLQRFLAQRSFSQIFVLTDENTGRYCLPVISAVLPDHATVYQVRAGEEHKQLATCVDIWKEMTVLNMDRHSLMIVLGGGVLGDMGGFCAATFKRGISFLLIPTTLLAQVDASVGGKLGIDFDHYKNHIGVFQEPLLTLIHTGFLQTLPDEQLKSGFAEVIKHALIADETKWNSIRTKAFPDQSWDDLVNHSVALKARVVQEDPTEKGLRKILNAGHTIGHALESFKLAQGSPVLHGEAVAAGLITESAISFERNMISRAEFEGVRDYILLVFGKISYEVRDIEAIASFVLQDKKNKGNRILMVLLEKTGRAKWDCEVSLDEVKTALNNYLLC